VHKTMDLCRFMSLAGRLRKRQQAAALQGAPAPRSVSRVSRLFIRSCPT
jgi:hypothetical protein